MHLPFCPVYAVLVDDWLTIALALALAARLTRLITLDTITQPIRDRLPGFLGALVQCPWCTGVWVAVPVGLSWLWWADQAWWQVTALIGALAWFAGAVSNAAMPSQHEVAMIGPVALLNADEPVRETVEKQVETTIHIDSGDFDPEEIAERVAESLRRTQARAATDDGDGVGGSS